MIELEELRSAAQKAFPADQLIPDRDASWQLVAEMGWLMVRVPEELGGLGLGREASTAIHFEMGRVLSPAPLTTALVTLEAMAASSSLANKEDWIERGCSGEFTAMSFAGGELELKSGDVLDARIEAVSDADMAANIMIKMPDLLALVPLNAPEVTIAERDIWDKSRKLFDVTIRAHAIAPENIIARGEEAAAISARIRGEMLLALAADSLGGANAALDMTVEYMNMRKQFERPIAMFQALKHRAADLKTRIVAAEALLWSRAGDAQASDTDLGALKTLAAEVYEFVTEEAIQLHGGIGLTDEHQCHLFMKRAMLNLVLGGSPDVWMERAGKQALENMAAG